MFTLFVFSGSSSLTSTNTCGVYVSGNDTTITSGFATPAKVVELCVYVSVAQSQLMYLHQRLYIYAACEIVVVLVQARTGRQEATFLPHGTN